MPVIILPLSCKFTLHCPPCEKPNNINTSLFASMMLSFVSRWKWFLFLISKFSFFLFLLHVGHIVTFTPVGSFQESSAGAPAGFPVTFDSNPKASFPPHSTDDPTGIPVYYPESSATPGNFHQHSSRLPSRFNDSPSSFPVHFTGTLSRFSGASSALQWTVLCLPASAYGSSVNSPAIEL